MVATPPELSVADPLKKGVGGGLAVQKLLDCGVLNGPNRLKVTFSPLTLPTKPDSVAVSLVVAAPTMFDVWAAAVATVGVAHKLKLPLLKSCRSEVTEAEDRVSARMVEKQLLLSAVGTVAVRSMPASKKPLVPTEPGAHGVVMGAVPLAMPHRFRLEVGQSCPFIGVLSPPVGDVLVQPDTLLLVQAVRQVNSEIEAVVPPLVKERRPPNRVPHSPASDSLD